MVTPTYYPTVGGVERVVENASLELNRIAVTTDILTFNFNWPTIARVLPSPAEMGRGSELKVFRVPAVNLLPWRLHIDNLTFKLNFIPRKFMKLMQEYDIIHFHNDTDLSFPFFAGLTKKPKIFHVHCLNLTYSFYSKNPIAKSILKRVADKYVCVYRSSKEMLVNLGLPSTDIDIVPNGIDTEKFMPKIGSKVENLILFAGRIDPAKGLTTLLKALDYLTTPCHIMIVGPYSNVKYYQEIATLADETNAKKKHSVILQKARNPDEMAELYQQATVFVLPSFSESFPMAVLEALACETPVVATSVGGIPDIIKSYENGILVPPNNPIKLAESIQYLLSNEKARLEYGIAGRKMVTASFSSRKMAEQLAQIYERMIQKT
jgi:glycosyltransferase involved in cell wall biosynthesis